MTRETSHRRIAPTVPRGLPIAIGTGFVELKDESDGSTSVLVNNVPSSSMRRDPAVLDFEYMRHMSAAIDAWEPRANYLALHLGAAACTLPRHLAHRWPASRHIAVDVDPALPDLARTWWDLPRAPRLRIRVQDGLDALVTRNPASVDLVVRDAFAGAQIPVHLTSDRWWHEARRVVRTSGIVVANVATKPGTVVGRDDVRAAREAFRHVVAVSEHAVMRGKRRGNVVLVAGQAIDIARLRRYAASAPLPTGVDEAWHQGPTATAAHPGG